MLEKWVNEIKTWFIEKESYLVFKYLKTCLILIVENMFYIYLIGSYFKKLFILIVGKDMEKIEFLYIVRICV